MSEVAPTEAERIERLQQLQARLDHTFARPELLDRALTHSSWCNEHDGEHNERLEFLGDAVLDAIVAQLLFRRYPAASEGVLSRQKHRLIASEPLARIGKDLGLGRILRVGTGARRMGVHLQPAKLEDATEALVAALYLDAGFARTVEIVAAWFGPNLERLDLERPRGAEAYKNAISRLHEAVARPPVRSTAHAFLIERTGTAHEPEFRMGWWVGGTVLGEGTGTSKKVARREAASVALDRLEELLAEHWRPDPDAVPPEDASSDAP